MRKIAIPFVLLLLCSLGVSADTANPVLINALGVTLGEDFNALVLTGTGAVATNTPQGWGFVETGTNANTSYTASNGGGTNFSGDTYSFGATGSAERAFGGVQSGSNVPIVGARFTNNTGATITSLSISYTGEQWRLGTSGRADRLDFQYSTSASTLNAAAGFVDVDALDFIAPVSVGTVGAFDGNATKANIASTITGLSIANGASFFIRWTDFNASGADDGLAIDDFFITADGVDETPADAPPALLSTTPAAGATNVPVDSNIAISFTEAVNAPAGAFSISCGASVAFGLSGSGTATITLDPNVALPYSTLCTVTLTASQITDTDTNDPPDALASAPGFSFTTEDQPPPVATNVMINELDSDTPGTDAAEFVELYDGGVGNTALDGLTVVFYNGSNDLSYAAFDLDGKKTDANGYFILGNAAVPGVGLTFNGNLLQNGADAVALYAANANSFPTNTPLTLNNLQDAVVYDTADADDAELLTLLTAGGQVDENSGGTGDSKSIGRCENGTGDLRDTSTFKTGAPSPAGVNNCPPPPLPFTTDPPANGINVPRDPTIVVSFNEAVTVLANPFDLTCASGQHNEHTMSAVGRFIDITPNVPLTPGELCTMTIFGDSVSDADGIGADPLPTNYSWTFKVAEGIAPPYGADVHLTFGTPNNAVVSDPPDPDNYLMLKPEYSLSYNASLGRPNWVSWHLTTEWFGTLPRVDTFRADPMVPPDWYRVQGFDFSGSGFDRGHMVPNADRDHQDRIPVNQATYLMTNMIAQAPDNNQGPWAAMENDLRTIAGEGNELYIVSGPQGIGGTGSNGYMTTIANGHVVVPAYTWKVALVLPLGSNDLSRVSCSTRTIAVILPNEQGIRTNDWHQYLTTVDAVEGLTGYNFFSNLPQNIQYCIEGGTNGNNLPADFGPPVISCGAADGQWHTGNVTLSCTVTDSVSGLANAADGSFTLSTSVAAGVEDGNASTNSREVCDKAGNCATAIVTGNRIDRKNPTIALMSPMNGASFALGSIVNAAFTCADSGSGLASCIGSAANGAAVDTASSGPHTFVVTATDVAGNTASASVTYTITNGPAHKRTPGITITNIPSSSANGGGFTPVYSYDGDGNIHLKSLTPSVCRVQVDSVVNFVSAGTCTLVPWATASGSVNPAQGAPQSFAVAP